MKNNVVKEKTSRRSEVVEIRMKRGNRRMKKCGSKFGGTGAESNAEEEVENVEKSRKRQSVG